MAGLRFPSFNQDLGPNFMPIGRKEDLAQAAKVAGSSRIYAALRPTEDTIDKVINGEYVYSWLIWPCGWPFIPCAIPCIMNRREELLRTLYVITEDSVLISVADYAPPCSCGCTTGRDSQEIAFDSITDVHVDNIGRGCNCCDMPRVTLSLVNNKQIPLLVESTEGTAHLLRELRRAHKNRRHGAPVVQQPVTVINAPQPQQYATTRQSKRIFVAGSQDPSVYHIVNLTGDSPADWNSFLAAVRAKLNYFTAAELKLHLADVNAEVSEAGQLDANDKVVVTLVFE